MKKIVSAIFLATFYVLACSTFASDKVVVISLGGLNPTGNVQPGYVLEGETLIVMVLIKLAP